MSPGIRVSGQKVRGKKETKRNEESQGNEDKQIETNIMGKIRIKWEERGVGGKAPKGVSNWVLLPCVKLMDLLAQTLEVICRARISEVNRSSFAFFWKLKTIPY